MTVFGTIFLITGIVVVLILLLAGLSIRSYQAAESKAEDYEALLDVHYRTAAAYTKTLEMISEMKLEGAEISSSDTIENDDPERMETDRDE